MPGKKMVPPRVPRQALLKLQAEYETAEISPGVRILADGVVLWFSQPTQFVLMRSQGARQLAAMLLARADELDGRTARKPAERK
jgi:hypothetical protein